MNNALPPYVFLPTGLFLAKLIAHKEGEDRSKWVTDFAVQLVEGAGLDDFARSLIDTAVIKQNAAMNRVRRSRAKSELISEGVKNPTRQQIEERLKEIYAEEEITAAAATREVVDESTTGCNHYDQETKVSTNSPDASVGNAEGVVPHGSPITRNGSRAACTSATSGQTFEAPQNQARESQPGAGEVTHESVSAPSPALPVPSKKAHGEFGNVLLTDDEFAKLTEKMPNAWDLITELDQYIESQGKTKKYKSHYATLLNWSRRKAQESKPKQGYKNINDINRETYEKSKREIHAMFHPEEDKAV